MNTRPITIFHPALGLVLMALLAGCGSENNAQTVRVNLSFVVNSQHVQHRPVSRFFAWIERWFPGATPAWAQSVSEIATIQVQVSGPGIPAPATSSVPVSNPTSGQEIPVSIQAPVGPNRTITAVASNAANQKIFGGTLPGVTLTAGAPIDLEITLVRLFTVVVQKDPQGTGDGTVTSSPARIDCGGTCSGQFEEGTTVSLNAAAAPGSVFAGWSGGCSGTGPCSVTNTATVTARFNVAVSTDRLTVTFAGTGTGTVTSNPSGIACPSTCAADFATGTTVTLTATPTNGSTFTGWSGGGCSGAGPCVVAMTGDDQTVTATFTAASVLFTLTVINNGTGQGTIDSSPPGIIACSTTCSAGFAPSTTVTLTATPSVGSTFGVWGGDCNGTGPCSVVMDANRSVRVAFNPSVSTSTLTVQKAGAGVGTVTSNPAGIDCGPACGSTAASFPTNSLVTLTANGAPGSTFVGWSGGGCSGTSPCSTTMSSAQTVVAQFDPAPSDLVTLTVTKQGSGDGTVTSDAGGISCGPGCGSSQASYPRGTIVTLTAIPDGDSSFNDWHGGGPCDNSSSLTCQLQMNDNETVSAHFDD